MDKTLLKNFSIYARNKLIQEIKRKASMVGIREEGINSPLRESTPDMLTFDIKAVETFKIYGNEIKQYKQFVKELKKREKNEGYKTAYSSIIEEVAYTWFNRLIAIRFMEVNNYLPRKIRVLSSGREGANEPEIVTNYLESSLDFNKKELDDLWKWKMDGSNLSMEKTFQLLFIKECNALNDNLPELFEKTDDYAELLLTISYNDPDGVLYKLVHEIPEEYFDVESEDGGGQVEIIGWMYQYYNTEKKDSVISVLAKGPVEKEDIPAATQLFTTDWVVRYMVDNSLGKYWLERNPDSSIKDSLAYLLPGDIEVIDEDISPEDLKVFDNAMGSGHCLIYAFDLLLKIYESLGYTKREAARLIVEKNLYGLDIDKRSYQLAYFAIMMKMRRYNRRALNGEIQTNIRLFKDSASINKNHLEQLGVSMGRVERNKAIDDINYLIDSFENATEIGSILILKEIDNNLIIEFIDDGPEDGQIVMGEVNIDKTQEDLKRLVGVAYMLIQKYHIVVTNPPYLNKFSPKLKKYINENYKDYKSDLFSVFIYRNLETCKAEGYSAYMSPFVWMFIKTYEKLREYIIETKHISSLIQMEYSAFEEATVPICTFVLKNSSSAEKGSYIRLSDFRGGMEVQRLKTLEAIENLTSGYYYMANQDDFEKMPGRPIAYWAGLNLIKAFEDGKTMDSLIELKVGLQTGNTERFLKLWYEVGIDKISFNSNSIEDSIESGAKWFPTSKGGPRRQWYGNYDYIVNWENDGFEIRNFKDDRGRLRSRPQNTNYYFKEAITWSLITSGGFSIRYRQAGSIHDVSGMSAFSEDHDSLMYILGLMSTKIADYVFKMLNPTINLSIGVFNNFPVLLCDDKKILDLVEANIKIARRDWNSFEEAWDFKRHPLLERHKILSETKEQKSSCHSEYSGESIPKNNTIERAYESLKALTNNNFKRIKENEEKLNRIFIEIYGLGEELTPEVTDRDITISKIFDYKSEIYDEIRGNRYILTKEDIVKSLISYGVGCILGRYSLDSDGLAYGGGSWDDDKYFSFLPAKDNIVLITDEEYFEDDLVNRFIEFIKISFGEKDLEENLSFIGQALGGKGIDKDIIRNYFLKDFFKDHLRRYQKRPIYWMYDSGRENGFKALIYMHRYDEDTTGKLRIDYLHRLQKVYERTMEDLKYDIANNKNPREIALLEKQIIKLTKQLKECKSYDEKIGHLAIARHSIDLDDGVKINYNKIQIDERGRNLKILASI